MDDEKNRIAVVGLATLFPGSVDATGFWRDILHGTDRITDVPPSHWLVEDYYDPDPSAPDKTYARRGAFLPRVEFEPMRWGVPPSTVEATDTCQLLALIVAQQVLEDAARGQFDYTDRSRMSVILGVTSAQELLGAMVSRLQRPVWTKALREMGLGEPEVQEACKRIEAHYTPWQEATFPGVLGNVVAGRIANRLDLGGTNCVTDAACASTFSALSMAVNELRLGESDVVICGGADTMNDIFMYLCFSKTPALSKTGDCRPFSDGADGTMLGEGFGMLALKRLADAERDGDRVYAVITGVGTSSDGKGTAVYAPVAAGQARALRRAYSHTGYGIETVELIEAHGTGTVAGDAAEFAGLSTVFDESGRADRQWCALGSVKSQIGHTKAAAGAAGLVKAILALNHRVLPPTIKVERPNPKLDLPSSPFYLSTVARPWVRGADHPRRAGVSSFGFGGSNFHVALEEYGGSAARALRRRACPTELVLVGGSSPADVAARARAMAAEVGAAPGTLASLARTSQETWDPSAPARLAVVAEDEASLAAKLERGATLAAAGEPTATPDGIAFGTGAPPGDVAFLFPGQGSQYVSMGADVAMTWEEALAPWDAAASLAGVFDEPLHDVVFPKPVFDDGTRAAQAEKLTRTEWAQPAIGVASLSHLALLDAVGLAPKAVAGHSFGEVTALAAAGVLSREDAIRVARRRGELMAEAAATPGAMTAVSAARDAIEVALTPWPEGLVVANHNGPTQVVLSGPLAAIEAAEAALSGAKLAFRRLPVATAFHSSVVAGSTEPFARFLESVSFSTPSVPVYANREAAPYPVAPPDARALLAAQLASPVRFVESIEAMYAAGARVFVEVGPGAVLSGLVERILEGRPHLAVPVDRKGKHGVTSLFAALGRLAAAGVPLSLSALWEPFLPVEDPRARVAPKMTLALSGSNYGKPYPPPNGAAGLPAPNPERSRPAPTEQDVSPMSKPTLTPPVATAPVAAAPASAAALAAPAPVAAAPVAAPPTAAPLAGDGWASAYLAVQSRVIDAHTAYTHAMATAHGTFLAAQQQALATMSGLLVGAPAASLAPLPPPPAIAPVTHAPLAPVAVVAPPAPLAPPALAAARAAHVTAPASLPAAPPRETAPVAAPGVDLAALLLEVVADKTGYPTSMLELSMDLEGDLGVDSIKRVEILAAMRERAGSLPEVDPAELGKLRTLQEIVSRLGDGSASASAEARAPEAARTEASRWVLERVAAPPSGFALAGLLDAASVAVVDGGSGLAESVAEALTVRGVRARAGSPDGSTDGVVFLGGLAEVGDGVQAALRVQREAFEAAKAVAARLSTGPGVFVTVQDTGGDFGLSGSPRAWLGGLPGLVKTLAQEWPTAGVRAIDLDRGGRDASAIATAIARELVSGGSPRGPGASGGGAEVAIAADGARSTLVSAPVAVGAGAPRLGREDVVVASGGARGVTARTLIALAEASRARFVLLGRTALEDEPPECAGATTDAELKRALLTAAQARGARVSPKELDGVASRVLAAREVRATLEAIGRAGGEARYLPVDVRDAAALRAALDEVRAAWGPITGLVHGAGVIADRFVADKPLEDFDRVMDVKAGGLAALLDATAGDPLRVLVAFSSVAGRTGNRGQADYAMANETLNKVVAREVARREGLFGRSLGWGPWKGGMVTPALEQHFARLGVPMIGLDEGARMLVEELSDTGAALELVLGGEPRPEALAAAGGGVGQKQWRYEALVSREAFPAVEHHRVKGQPVLPVALALELFARAVEAARPELVLTRIDDLAVLKGVVLERFEAEGDRLAIEVALISNGDGIEVGLKLTDASGRARYSARGVAERAVAAPSALPARPAGLGTFEGVVYDGVALFHGDAFKVIVGAPAVGDAGAEATVEGARARGWGGAGFATDPALVDGGLQLALLWTCHADGGAALPTAVKSFRRYRAGLLDGAARAVLVGHQRAADRSLSDVVFFDASGEPVAELRGVAMHVLPGSRERASARA
ncbi:MAG: SDR family oxidoreductase [Sandaracinaceae bacterium]|nr:SDR family oxidoreductase [Sandaracinaceae bacterium]